MYGTKYESIRSSDRVSPSEIEVKLFKLAQHCGIITEEQRTSFSLICTNNSCKSLSSEVPTCPPLLLAFDIAAPWNPSCPT